MPKRIAIAVGLIVILISTGCASMVRTAVMLPFDISRQAQQLAVGQIEAGMKIADHSLGLIDRVGEVAHNCAVRKIKRQCMANTQ